MDASNRHAFDYLVIVDFEATCDEGAAPVVTRENQEIIEFPWIVFDPHNLQIIDKQQQYVKPVNVTTLPRFCTQLTGITDAMLETAPPLVSAVQRFDEYLGANFTAKSKTFCLVTDGGWDLKQALMRECKKKNIILAPHYFRFFDAKLAFKDCMKMNKTLSLKAMAMALNIPMEKHHSGLADCATVCNIVQQLCIKGYKFTTPETIPGSYDPDADKDSFPPFNTSGLVNPLAPPAPPAAPVPPPAAPAASAPAAAQAASATAAAMPAVAAPPQPAGTNSYATANAPAATAPPAAMPGSGASSYGGSTYTYMVPTADSYAAQMHNASAQLAPSYNTAAAAYASQMRPGDWICPSCSDLNFAMRTSCRKCNTPAPNGAAAGRPQPPAKEGDWICQSCQGLNFAMRETCYTCRSSRFATGRPASPQRRENDWRCAACSDLNFGFRAFCRRCGAPPTGGAAAGGAPRYGATPGVGAMGGMGGMGAMGGMGGGGYGGGGGVQQRQRPGDWNCARCSDMNYASREVCRRCGTSRMESAAASSYGAGGAAASYGVGAAASYGAGAAAYGAGAAAAYGAAAYGQR